MATTPAGGALGAALVTVAPQRGSHVVVKVDSQFKVTATEQGRGAR